MGTYSRPWDVLGFGGLAAIDLPEPARKPDCRGQTPAYGADRTQASQKSSHRAPIRAERRRMALDPASPARKHRQTGISLPPGGVEDWQTGLRLTLSRAGDRQTGPGWSLSRVEERQTGPGSTFSRAENRQTGIGLPIGNPADRPTAIGSAISRAGDDRNDARFTLERPRSLCNGL